MSHMRKKRLSLQTLNENKFNFLQLNEQRRLIFDVLFCASVCFHHFSGFFRIIYIIVSGMGRWRDFGYILYFYNLILGSL